MISQEKFELFATLLKLHATLFKLHATCSKAIQNLLNMFLKIKLENILMNGKYV